MSIGINKYNNADFNQALMLLECSDLIEWKGKLPVLSACKILNEAALRGSVDEKKTLATKKASIIDLNKQLKNTVNQELIGLQIRLPETSLQKFITTATKAFRVAAAVLLDLSLLPTAGFLTGLMSLGKLDLNPKKEDVIKGKPAILFLHGAGFNSSGFIAGMHYLKSKQQGSMFTLNYDNLLSNTPNQSSASFYLFRPLRVLSITNCMATDPFLA